MADLNNRTFYDLDGNAFIMDFNNGTVTLYGSHFHGVVPMAILSTTGLWMVAFFVLLVAYCKIVSNAGPGDRARKYLRWPVMGLSTVFMIQCFALDFANRIMHEMQVRESGLILLLPVFETIAYGLAQGLLIAFLLWQFTPLLLAYAKVSEKRQKTILVSFKGLVFLIGLLDTVDTIWSVVIYITQAVLILENKQVGKYGQSTSALERAYNIGAGPVDVAFHALYFVCVFVFAVVACLALRTEHKGKTLDRPTRIYLPTLTVSLVLRSALDLVWALVFNLISDFRNINTTFVSRLIHCVLYGFFSVVTYASILGITAHNDPRDAEVRHDLVSPPRDWDRPSRTAMCLLCGLSGLFMHRRTIAPTASVSQPSYAQAPMYAAPGTPSKQMDASGSYISVPQGPQIQYDDGHHNIYVPRPAPLQYGVPPPSFEPGRHYGP